MNYGKRRYINGNLVQIVFGRLQCWRHVATQCDRCPTVSLSAIAIYLPLVLTLEPMTEDRIFLGLAVIDNLESFTEKADIFAANRLSEKLNDVTDELLTRDLFGIRR